MKTLAKLVSILILCLFLLSCSVANHSANNPSSLSNVEKSSMSENEYSENDSKSKGKEEDLTHESTKESETASIELINKANSMERIEVQKGTVFLGLTVDRIYYAIDETGQHATVDFGGAIHTFGKLINDDMLLLFVLSEESKEKIPAIFDLPQSDTITFRNTDKAIELLQNNDYADEELFEIVIEEYSIRYSPNSSRSDIATVISINGKHVSS